ncbi:hypothetical protein [Plantactinospora sp. KLBMP9567]|uniref:hypothetical protein n=1 Tax=Plantactinospora sp. KLBMP9567 TaxID=3085900 RepID=UPI002981F119|nr:hypothetical protein [Plantactinospora sp. KLBMP9567]MDW5329655.1 hypothetical protein [Plantactinospora sp. KLBMP9567]
MSGPSSDNGPIEYVGKTDRRAKKTAPTAASPEPSADTAPAAGKAQPARFGWLWSVGLLVGIAGQIVAYVAFHEDVRAAALSFACDVSACSAAGMTTAGWLVIAAPAAILVGTSQFMSKLAKPGRVALGASALLVGMVSTTFIPGRGQDLLDLLDGPGSNVVADGILWGFGTAGAVLVFRIALFFVACKIPAVERRHNMVALVGAVVLIVGALPVAIAKSDPTWVRAAEIFPPVLTMNGDTLTRVAADDQRGCDGVLPDDALLNRRNCYLTVRAEFTTDDSDAVVTFRAVLYSDEETADEVRAGLPDRLTPVGVTGSTITVLSTTYSWVLVGAAKHTDGHGIATDERPWVLWPLRQVNYHFIGVQAGIFIDPDPTDEIRPRTP